MRYSISSILLVLFVGLLTGCKESPTTNDPVLHESDGIMPLKVGNEWRYRILDYDSNDDFIGQDSSGFRITGEENLGGEIWFRRSGPGEMYVNRADGLWYRLPVLKDSFRVIKYPVAVNDTFDTRFFFDHPLATDDTLLTNWRVEDVAATVDVPAGRFTCHHFKRQYRTRDGILIPSDELRRSRIGDEEEFWAPGIGMVLRETRDYNMTGEMYRSFHQELTGYVVQ